MRVAETGAWADRAIASMSVVERFEGHVLEHPRKRALTWFDSQANEVEGLSYAELHARAHGVGAALLRKGCRPGQRVLLVYPPGLPFFEAFLACLLVGLIPVPCYPPNPLHKEPRLAFLRDLCARADIAVALTSQRYNRARRLGLLKHALTGGQALPALDWIATDGLPARGAVPPRRPPLDEVAFVQFTSGSTTHPRGVLLTYGNLAHQIAFNARALKFNPDTRGVVWLPQYHDFGLISIFLSALTVGCSVYFCDPMDFLKRPMGWLEMVDKVRGTHIAAPDFAYAHLLRRARPGDGGALDLSCLKCVMWAAEPIQPTTVEAFYRAFAPSGLSREALIGAYGLAEHTVGVTIGPARTRHFDGRALEQSGRLRLASPEEEAAVALVSSGRLDATIEVRVVEPGGSAPVEAGSIGEIVVQSASVAQGYLGEAEASRSIFGQGVDGEQGCWLRTGDLGAVFDGELFVTGRQKELIIVRGKNLFPTDVEQAVRDSNGALRPGGIAAIEVDSGEGAQLGVLVELYTPPATAQQAQDIAEAVQAAAVQAGFPVSWVGLAKKGALPKTTSGKLQRSLCAAQVRDGTFEAQGALTHRFEFSVPDGAAGEPDTWALPLAEVVALLPSMGPDEGRDAVEEALKDVIVTLSGARASEQLGPSTPFFSVGLDSLQLSSLLAAVERATGRQLEPEVLAGLDTLADVTGWILSAAAREEAPAPAPPSAQPGSPAPEGISRVRATGIQQLIFKDHGTEPGYAITLELTGPFTPALLTEALAGIVARHDIFHAAFEQVDGALFMRRVSPPPAATVERFEAAPGVEEAMARRCREPFDLGRPPFFRALWCQQGEGRATLQLCFHHLIYDPHTVMEFQRDCWHALTELAAGRAPQAEPGPSYFAYAAALESGSHDQRAFWRDALAGAQWPLPVASDVVVSAHALTDCGAFTLGPERLAELRRVARGFGATVNHVVFLAWALALSETLCTDDVLVAYAISTRGAGGGGPLGPVVNDLLIRLRCEPGVDRGTLIRRSTEALMAGAAHGAVPYLEQLEMLGQQMRDRVLAVATCPCLYRFIDWDGVAVSADEVKLRKGERIGAQGLGLRQLALEKPSKARPYDYFAAATVEGDALVAEVRVQTERVGPALGLALLGAWEGALNWLMTVEPAMAQPKAPRPAGPVGEE